ncbi:hypothetical protein [Rhizobium sp. RU35A]|uniref:hypothetical protein n=1 Tax=Rhizobium sp. RU35A TaxID=1907414 RepID=UPI00122C4027|nr:hypothetical protein [Rhizobium sp. RU35A]
MDTTAASAQGTSFSPAEIFFVQVDGGADQTVFDVLARVDAGAVWQVIDSLGANERIGRYAPFPFVRIDVRGNTAGNSAKAWSSV